MNHGSNASAALPLQAEAGVTQEKRASRGFWQGLYAGMVRRRTRSILSELRAHRRLVREIRRAPSSFSLARLKHEGQLPFDR